MVCPTHREGQRISQAVRADLKGAGALGEERKVLRLVDLRRTEAEKTRPELYEPGQVVHFHRRSGAFRPGDRAVVVERRKDAVLVRDRAGAVRALSTAKNRAFSVARAEAMEVAVGDIVRATANGAAIDGRKVSNGTSYRVVAFESEGVRVAPTAKQAKREEKVLPYSFGSWSHGYVSTSHASQGRTVDRVLLAQGAESYGATSREQFYVSLSRGRASVEVYTDDKAGLMRAIERGEQRPAAMDLEQDRGSLAFKESMRTAIDYARDLMSRTAERVRELWKQERPRGLELGR